MTDRPILFSAPMVRALLDGRKTRTRRIMKVQPPKNEDFPGSYFGVGRKVADGVKWFSLNEYPRLPKHPTKWDLDGSVGVARTAGFPMEYDAGYAMGDHLYVREEYYQRGSWAPVEGAVTKGGKPKWAFVPADARIQFHPQGSFRRARDASDPATVWLHKRLGRFMPRAASRLTLSVTDVRVERLNDCSEADAIAEGLEWVAPGKWSVDRTLPIIGDDPRRVYAELWDHINGAGAWDANPWVVAVSFDVRKGNIDG